MGDMGASQEMPAIGTATVDPCIARICRACRPSGATWAIRGPKFSRATTYEPPARVYTETTSR